MTHPTRQYPGHLGPALCAAVVAAVSAFAPTALAVEPRFAASGLFDAALAPDVSGQGALLLGVDLAGDAARGHIVFDTETLYGGVDGLRIADRLWFGAEARGEYGFASLLPVYYREGARDASRGIAASYVGGSAQLTWSPSQRHWVRLRAGARYWWFDRLPDTDPAFVLPEERALPEVAAEYTWWNLRDDSDFHERHRVFPRVVGVATGVGVNLWAHGDTRPWGVGPDIRNTPDPVAVRPQAWLIAGTWLHDRLRWQLDHRAAWGVGEDDLTRARAGGLNRYALPLAGAPWGAFVTERFVASQWSWHVPVAGASEVGVLASGILLDDAGRTGASLADFEVGAGILADLRFGDWQVDARAGVTPTVHDSRGLFGASAMVAVGWGEPAP